MPLLLCLMDQGIVAVFDHVLTPSPLEEFWNHRPFLAILLDCLKQLEIFLFAPTPLAKSRKQMIRPLLPTFFPCFEDGAPRSHKHHVRSLTPLQRVSEFPSLPVKYLMICNRRSFSCWLHFLRVSLSSLINDRRWNIMNSRHLEGKSRMKKAMSSSS